MVGVADFGEFVGLKMGALLFDGDEDGEAIQEFEKID